MSSGGGTQKTTYQPPAEVMAAYKDLISRGQGMLGGQAPQYDPAKAAQYGQYNAGLVAPMTPDQIQAMRSIAGTQGYTDPFINASANMASSSGAPLDLMRFSGQQLQQYMSPYLNNVVKSAVGNINETNAQQQQQVLGNAIARGAFGGDRSGVAQSELARQQGLAGNATIANLLNSGYGQALGQFNIQQAKDLEAQALSRQYGIQGAQALANIGVLGQKSALEQAQAQFGAGLAGQQQQQANLSTAYQQYLNQFQHPYNQLGWYGGLISGAGSGMGGTTSANMPGASPLSSVLGIGSMLGAMGGSSGIMGLAGLFSDERVKENIEPVGETYDGQQIYRYNYKGEPRTQIGLIAQEVKKRHPKAVGDMGDGILGVNYRDATEKAAERGHFYDGGVVGHYSDGGKTWVNTKSGSNSGSTPSTTPSTWGYVTPNPQGDLTTPALNTYQNMAMSGQGSYDDLMGSYNNYLKSFQMPAGSELPMVGFAPKPPATTPDAGNNKPDKNDKYSRFRDAYEQYKATGKWSFADGGVVGHYQGGGLVPQIRMDYGLQTRNDLKNAAEQAVGSGVMADPATEALAAEDMLGVRAHGGRIHKAFAGEVSGDQAADAAGVVPPEPIKDEFEDIIQKTLPRIKMSESGGKNIANQAGTSSAFGPYQFTHGTWKDLITSNPDLKMTEMDRLKADAQEKVAPIFARNIATQFKRENIPVTPETLKMGWFLGPQGATNFMKRMAQDPDAPAYELDPRAAKANQEVFFNKDGTPKSINQVFGQLSSSLGREEKPTPQTLLDKILGRTPSSSGAQVASNMAPASTGRQAAGGFFPGLDDPGRLALFKFGATMAGTPGPFGYGLAAAANAYADSMIGSKRLETESAKREADTRKALSEAALAQTLPGAYGRQYLELDAEGKPVKFKSLPFDMSQFEGGGAGGAGTQPQTGVSAPSGEEATPGQAAPTSPSEAAPQAQPIELAGPYMGQNKTDALKEFINEDRMLANNPQQMEFAKTQFAKDLAVANDDGDKSVQNTGNLNTLAKTVTNFADIGQKTFASGGQYAGERANLANTVNLGAELLGLGKNVVNENDITSQQLLTKMSRIGVVGNRMANEAAASLVETQKAYPQADQTTATRAIITAQMLGENQRRKDKMAFAQYYGSNKTGTGGYGTRMTSAFNKVNTPGAYETEKIALMKELMHPVIDGGKKQNAITLLLENPNDPQRQEQFNQYMKQKYKTSTNMARYFVE